MMYSRKEQGRRYHRRILRENVHMLLGRNLLDCRYEMVRDYPMPGRSVLGGFTFKF